MTTVLSAVASIQGGYPDYPAVGAGSDRFMACDRSWLTLTKGKAMGLSWQQGLLSPGAIGRFLLPEALPKRLPYAEPLRRCMRVRFGATWIADSQDVLVLFEPGRYPVAYFPETDVSPASPGLAVRHRDRIIANTKRPIVPYESGFAPRCYAARADVDESALTSVEHQSFCPYKGPLCRSYDIGDAYRAAWSYREACPEAGRICDLGSFKPDMVSVQLDGTQLRPEPGQAVISHGPDRDLTVAEALPPRSQP